MKFIDLPPELTQLSVCLELFGSAKLTLLIDSLCDNEQQSCVVVPDTAHILVRLNKG